MFWSLMLSCLVYKSIGPGPLSSVSTEQLFNAGHESAEPAAHSIQSALSKPIMNYLPRICKLLSALPLVVSALGLNVDASHNGDVAVEIDMGRFSAPHRLPEDVAPKSEQGWRITSKKLEEYQVDIGYEIHQGFLTVSQMIINGFIH